ncbi:Protein F15A4.6 [Aphelenchoides avenae]|nr:Protein F15A4.6 [Aphelenchus avenae]
MAMFARVIALVAFVVCITAETAPLVCKDERDATYCVSVKSFCFDQRYVQGMSQMCAKTCGFCTTEMPKPQTGPIAPGCKDNHYQGTSYCLRNIIYCTDYYRDSMTRYCAKTCGFCPAPSSPPDMPPAPAMPSGAR